MLGNANLDYSGQIIGNYLILEKLGSGEFGSVYRAQNRMIAERIVAIKLINDKYVSSPEECAHFINEARVLLKLQHRSILPVIDIGEHNSVPYMVLAFASGGSLRTLLASQPDRKLPLEQALTVLTQLGQGLQYAHQQGVVHRDLKPDNILFNALGEALLADFGIATEVPTSTIRNAESITGTPPYMSPEQFQGIVSKLSDQYALGCIAYELVTGSKPFQASDLSVWAYKHTYEQPRPPSQLNPAIPPHIDQAILRAMAKARSQRFPDIASFVAALSSAPTVAAPATRMFLKGPQGQIALGSAQITIGRAPDNTLVLNDREVSGHHTTIHQSGTGYAIIDLNSTNKTFLNEQAIPPQVERMLQPGDSIRVGGTTFEYVQENTGATPSPATPPVTPTLQPSYTPAPATPTPALQSSYAPPPPPGNQLAGSQRAGWNTPVQQPLPPLTSPVRQKSRRRMWISLSVLALVIIIVGIILYNLPPKPPIPSGNDTPTSAVIPQLLGSYSGKIIDNNQDNRLMTLSNIDENSQGNTTGYAGFACDASKDFCGTTSFTGSVTTSHIFKFTITLEDGSTINFTATVSADNTTLSNGSYSGNNDSGTWSEKNTPGVLPTLSQSYDGTSTNTVNPLTNGMEITISGENPQGNLTGTIFFSKNANGDCSFCGNFTMENGSVNTDESFSFQLTAQYPDGTVSTVTFTGTISAASGKVPSTKLSGTYNGTQSEKGTWQASA